DRHVSVRGIEVDYEQSVPLPGGIQHDSSACVIDRDPVRLLIVANHYSRYFARMLTVTYIECDEAVIRRHSLNPVVRGENRNSTVSSVECMHERCNRCRTCHITEQIQPAIERVDVNTPAVSEKPRLARELVCLDMCTRTRRQCNRTQQFEIGQPPDLHPLRCGHRIAEIHVGSRRYGAIDAGNREDAVRID